MANFSCKRVKPMAPEATTLDSVLVAPVSTINVPIHYEIAKLEEIVNSKVKGTFIRDQFKLNDKGDSLYLEVEKKGPILLSWNDHTLYYSVPLKVSAKILKHIAGIKVRNANPVEMEMVLHLATRLALDDQWNLRPQSSLDDIKWVKEPTLKVTVIKFNLKKVVEEALEKNKDKLIPKMDEALSSLIDTRKIVSKLWNDIQKPIRVNKKEKQLWLKAYATNITARLANAGSDKIVLHVQLKARVELIIEGQSIPESNTELPRFKKIEHTADSLLIFVLTRIPYHIVNEVLNEELSGKKISAEGYATTIRNVEVYGTPGGLALKLNVRGDVNGRVYATAIPGYDSAQSRLYAENFSFDLDTESALLNSADWLLHEHALDFISNQLTLDAQPLIDLLPDLIMQAIEKGKVGDKIDLGMSSLSIWPATILVTKKELQILFQVEGKADIGLKRKVFAGKKKTSAKK